MSVFSEIMLNFAFRILILTKNKLVYEFKKTDASIVG